MKISFIPLLICLSLAPSLIRATSFPQDTIWQVQLDSIWGTGAPTEAKLAIFDSITTLIDSDFAGFPDLPGDWDAKVAEYRDEITLSVSKGRFTAILNYLSMYLYDGHSRIYHPEINRDYEGKPGIPVVYVGDWNTETRFGAALTPLPDSSLLVYNVIPEHPFNLQPGDRILGYDGIKWNQWVDRLLDAELPVAELGPVSLFAGTEESLRETWLSGAGRNWHLFDTLDVLPYGSSDTLHYSTLALQNISGRLPSTDQIPIPGVPMPDTSWEDPVSWGIISGTEIGYIYIWSWYHNSADRKFTDAVDSLINVMNVDGIILDMRCNHGGYLQNCLNGLSLLTQDSLPKMGHAHRDWTSDRMSFLYSWEFQFNDRDTTSTFSKPIAVLVGPKTASAAEYFTLWLSYLPNVRIFGKPTNGSFGNAKSQAFGTESWIAIYTYNIGILDVDSVQYLAHHSAPLDEQVWLTPESVVQGKDNVVETARTWIELNTSIRQSPALPSRITLAQNYPNPFNLQTTFRFSLDKDSYIKLLIYNVEGRLVETVCDQVYSTGTYEIRWAPKTLASGIYFYRLQTKEYQLVKKMIMVK